MSSDTYYLIASRAVIVSENFSFVEYTTLIMTQLMRTDRLQLSTMAERRRLPRLLAWLFDQQGRIPIGEDPARLFGKTLED